MSCAASSTTADERALVTALAHLIVERLHTQVGLLEHVLDALDAEDAAPASTVPAPRAGSWRWQTRIQ